MHGWSATFEKLLCAALLARNSPWLPSPPDPTRNSRQCTIQAMFGKKPALKAVSKKRAFDDSSDDDTSSKSKNIRLPVGPRAAIGGSSAGMSGISEKEQQNPTHTTASAVHASDNTRLDSTSVIPLHSVDSAVRTDSVDGNNGSIDSANNTINGMDEIDEIDEIDAYMNQLQEQSMTINSNARKSSTLDDEDDHMESYVKHMQSKGVIVGSGKGSGSGGGAFTQSAGSNDDSDVNSDEEVYATARAIDAQDLQLLENYGPDGHVSRGRGRANNDQKDMDPLPPIDHSAMDYPTFVKNFYKQHADIASLSDSVVATIRNDLNMRVFGRNVPSPCIAFAHFGFSDMLLQTIVKHGYSEPTAIQRQAVPIAMSGYDLIGVAQTGSGKTAAFLWPMLIHIMDQPELERGDGPIGLVLAPTRELAHQIYLEAKKFARAFRGLRVSVLYGGVGKNEQFKELRAGVELLVATPGRLIDLIKMKATNLSRVTFLVLDEADQMLNLGFEPQVRSICSHIRPDRQTLLFSATFRKRIEYLVRELLSNPIRISIGDVGQSNSDITQIPIVLESDDKKWEWLAAHLPPLGIQGSVLVFVSRKAGVDELAANLCVSMSKALQASGTSIQGGHVPTTASTGSPFPSQIVGALHGDLMQAQRDHVLKDFKSGRSRVLVSTDVAARGLDIKGVKTVINYDVSKDIDAYVHRIGRTGRAGEKGTAYTLITMQEDRFAADLVQLMENGHQAPPEPLVNLAMQNPWFRKRRLGGGRGGGRGNASDRGGFSDRARGRGRGRGGLGFQRGGGNGANATGSNSLLRGVSFVRGGSHHS
ncbi:hypothetical protein BASA50_001140 [Batrachochytrium salamandrivorans]|uniref:RNA helicase n=1 Tax=Batrachochytrium salamandrivorans TaxID=1357716 RepID=A0ABQ8ERR1_9FUNG|nr:hypothetical protein BASA60_008808 [Batrachochytrium salamandrivorans]KAH6578042.1 hypothetical protein BASA62_000481 [Batrachochytrium salamandrivorans]KAH6585531.1 hypothetical protein BASA50_001140 [Batrachochytrium salamandrivorans]KAH6587116.1 hypothetical protein BASA61_006388 [Batrachochytrium salamandrivorans]KAH9248386.1 hypothetical protein BASA81_013972 [Batrachochytrium salamandrivorans]